MKSFDSIRTESTAAYSASLEKIANDKKLKVLTKADRVTLNKLAVLMANEKSVKEETGLEEAVQDWTVTVAKPVNKLKKGAVQKVKARSAFEAINKAVKLWGDPALKSAPIASFNITKESVQLEEGKMKELQDYIDQGKSAEWIAKKIGYPVKDVKNFLKGYQKEDLDEAVDKSSDVYKEYLSLKKKSIADLRKMVGQSQRGAVDLKSYDKQGAISDLLRNKFGGKKVDAAMGLSEAYKKGDKVTVKNAKKYDAFSKPEVSGVVMGVTKDGVQVKVGTGSMTVDSKDIKESLEEAVRSHPKGYDRLSSSEYSKAKKNKNFSKDDWAWDNKVDLYTRVTNEDLDEAFYKAGSEKSKLDSGYRSHLKNDEGKTAYIGNVSYKKADTAKGEAEAYGDAYYKTAGKSGNERAADKAILKYRQSHKQDIVESVSPGDYLSNYKKSTGKSVADPIKFRKTKFAILKNKKPAIVKGKEVVVVGQGNAEKAVAELQARDPKNDYKAMRTEALTLDVFKTMREARRVTSDNNRYGNSLKNRNTDRDDNADAPTRKQPAGKFAIYKDGKPMKIKGQDVIANSRDAAIKTMNTLKSKEFNKNNKFTAKLVESVELDEAVSNTVKLTSSARSHLMQTQKEVKKLLDSETDASTKKHYKDVMDKLNWADGRIKQLGKEY